MQKLLKVGLTLGLLLSPLIPFTVVRAAAVVDGTDNLSATVGVTLRITDIEITGITGDIPVKLLVTHGTLEMSVRTGLTFTGGVTGPELYFHGDVEDVNAALASLSYTRNSAGTDELEVSLVEPGEVFFSDNGHLYEFISVGGGVTWTNARTAAAALTRYDAAGYLATITSAEENAFITARLEGAGWMGASDSAVEDAWRWVTGPENGNQFWNGDGGGSPIPGQYANWNNLEPNDSGNNEDCGQFLSGGGNTGKWNDLPCTVNTLSGYVVEFGAPGDLPETGGNEFTITTFTAPLVTTLSPADNSLNVNRNANLVMTFDQPVNVGAGNITIHRASDDFVYALIDVTSNQVTGSGTNTITINPSQGLPGSTEVYVQIANTAFSAVSGGDYHGISIRTLWTFTTERAPSSTSVFTVPITSASLEVISANAACNTDKAVGSVQLQAQGAQEYWLANESQFLTGSWQPFTTGEATIPWTFATNSGTTKVYGLLRNTSGTTVQVEATATIKNTCEDPEITPPEQEPIDEDDTEDDTTSPTPPLTGPSPWNGTIENITDVSDVLLIKGENYDTVYLLENGQRRPFMNESIYFTWFNDFTALHAVTDATLATIPMGSPMLPKEGSLVKIVSQPEVFLVIRHNQGLALQLIPNEAAAKEQFGADWARRVIDLDVTLFNKFVK